MEHGNPTPSPQTVSCPKCGAYAGMPCRAAGGYGAAHDARVAKAGN